MDTFIELFLAWLPFLLVIALWFLFQRNSSGTKDAIEAARENTAAIQENTKAIQKYLETVPNFSSDSKQHS